jgi:hypothetical protein
MAKSPKQQEPEEDEAVIMERMEQALKRALHTPHETHKQMVARRRGQLKPKRARKK